MSARVALVTGAAGAIGGAIVRRLADDGLTVAGVDVAVGADYRCDVRSEEEVLRLRGEVESRHGTPWLLVNVAGALIGWGVPRDEAIKYAAQSNRQGG